MKVVETILPKGRVVEIKALPDGSFRVVQEVDDTTERIASELNDDYVFIEAESLSLEDKFMAHEPLTEGQKITKKLITEAIEKGVVVI